MVISFNNLFSSWNGLFVEQVLPDQYLPMSDLLTQWADIADLKIEQLEQMDEDHPDLAIFNDSLSVATDSAHQLKNLTEDHSAYACRDAEKREQGIVIIRAPKAQDCLKVEYLITHPCNIRSIVNVRESSSVKGVGTALMRRVEELFLTTIKKSRIELYPTLSASAFYEKLGYCVGCREVGFERYKTIEMLIEQI